MSRYTHVFDQDDTTTIVDLNQSTILLRGQDNALSFLHNQGDFVIANGTNEQINLSNTKGMTIQDEAKGPFEVWFGNGPNQGVTLADFNATKDFEIILYNRGNASFAADPHGGTYVSASGTTIDVQGMNPIDVRAHTFSVHT